MGHLRAPAGQKRDSPGLTPGQEPPYYSRAKIWFSYVHGGHSMPPMDMERDGTPKTTQMVHEDPSTSHHSRFHATTSHLRPDVQEYRSSGMYIHSLKF